jgi:class 3 adenylate cyclase
VRARLHTVEWEVLEGKVGGIAVHIGARVAAQGRPGEVLVSSTVKDLIAGSGLSSSSAAGRAEGRSGRGATVRRQPVALSWSCHKQTRPDVVT